MFIRYDPSSRLHWLLMLAYGAGPFTLDFRRCWFMFGDAHERP